MHECTEIVLAHTMKCHGQVLASELDIGIYFHN